MNCFRRSGVSPSVRNARASRWMGTGLALQNEVHDERFAAGPGRFVGDEIAQQPGIFLARGALGGGVTVRDLLELFGIDVGQTQEPSRMPQPPRFTWYAFLCASQRRGSLQLPMVFRPQEPSRVNARSTHLAGASAP